LARYATHITKQKEQEWNKIFESFMSINLEENGFQDPEWIALRTKYFQGNSFEDASELSEQTNISSTQMETD
jgi:hypothetical protein